VGESKPERNLKGKLKGKEGGRITTAPHFPSLDEPALSMKRRDTLEGNPWYWLTKESRREEK